MLNRELRDCQDLGAPEQMPRFIGRAIFMLMTPKPGAKGKERENGEGPRDARARPGPAAEPEQISAQ